MRVYLRIIRYCLAISIPLFDYLKFVVKGGVLVRVGPILIGLSLLGGWEFGKVKGLKLVSRKKSLKEQWVKALAQMNQWFLMIL